MGRKHSLQIEIAQMYSERESETETMKRRKAGGASAGSSWLPRNEAGILQHYSFAKKLDRLL